MSTDNLSEWLEAVWHDTEGYVHLRTRDKDNTWRQSFAKWPAQKDQIVSFVLKNNAQGRDVYYAPPVWKSKELSKESFLGSWVLWADFDGNAPSDNWPVGEIPPPSARIQSSSAKNQHTYWFLDSPVEDVAKLENLNRTLAYSLDSDTSVWNYKRVLRLPNTTNYGYGKDRTETYPVFIEELSRDEYPVDQFKLSDDFRPVIKQNLGDIPDIRKVLSDTTWSTEMWSAFNASPEEGIRSDLMQKVAYYGAEAGFTAEQIYAVLLDCDDRWKKYKSRTDRDQRISGMIDRALTKYPEAVPELTFNGLTGTGSNDIILQDIYSYEDFIATEIHMEWILEGMLSVGGYGIIAGEPGIGKSQFSLRLAESISTGQDFLGYWKYSGPPRRVLFVSLEMQLVELQQIFSSMKGFLPEHKDNFFISAIGDTLPLDRPDGQKYLEALLQKSAPDVVIIDSLGTATDGKITDEDTAKAYNKFINRIRVKYGCAVVMIHHNRKGQDRRFIANTQDDLFGGRYIARDPHFIYMLYRHPKEPRNIIYLNPAKLRFMAQFEPLRLQHTSDLNFVYEGELWNDNDEAFAGGSGVFFNFGSPES